MEQQREGEVRLVEVAGADQLLDRLHLCGVVGGGVAAGLLGPRVNLVPCNTLADEEWRAIAEAGASVSITPSSEMQMGQGTPPIVSALRHGVTTSIGVDVETSAPNDIWTQMRILFALQRSTTFDYRDMGASDWR